jgi:hypothetical protein
MTEVFMNGIMAPKPIANATAAGQPLRRFANISALRRYDGVYRSLL